jgi:peptidoglycan/LPS O-acetylase OafA/YrhL
MPRRGPAKYRGDMNASQSLPRRIAVLLAAITASLAVASGLHLSGQVHGRGAMYDADSAGVAELVIGLVLAAATTALWRKGSRAMRAALWCTGFAVAGFCVGLTFTAEGGHWPDVAYHLAVLPLLVLSFVALLRAGHVPSGT